MSQAELAGTELTKGFISQLELGHVRPSMRSLRVIGARLGIDLTQLLRDDPAAARQRVEMHRAAAEAAAAQGHWDDLRKHVASALEQGPPLRERITLLRLVATAAVTERDADAALDTIGDALALAEDVRDAVEVVELMMLRARAYGLQGHGIEAVEELERAREHAERHGVRDAAVRARLLTNLGTAYRRVNRTAKAAQLFEAALEAAASTPSLELVGRAHVGIAVSFYDSGEIAPAIEHYRRAVGAFHRAADIEWELASLSSLAEVHLEHRDLGSASDAAKRAFDRARHAGATAQMAQAQLVLAKIALARRELDEAERLARAAEGTLAGGSETVQRADALRVLGGVQHLRKKYAASDRAFRRAIELLRAGGHGPELASLANDYADRLYERGDADAAYRMLVIGRGNGAGKRG